MMEPFCIPFDPEEHGHLPVSRNSERKAFTWCRQQWYWRYIDQIVPKEIYVPFSFGDLIHKALGDWHIPGRERGPHPAESFRRYYDLVDRRFNIRDQDTKQWEGAEELGVAILNNYVDTFGEDDDWEVISPEMAFQVVVLDKNGEPYVRVIGRMDAVVRSISTGRLKMLEHKALSSIRINHLTLDDQAGTYWTFGQEHLRHLGLLEEDEMIDEVLYNILRKAKPDPRPRDDKGRYLNKDGTVSKKQPAPYFERYPVRRGRHEMEMIVDRIRKQTWEIGLVKEGKLPIYKSTGLQCTRCRYFSLCELHEAGADWEEFVKLSFTKRHPYEDYEEAAANLERQAEEASAKKKRK